MKVDVHCHLTAVEFSRDLDAVMQRVREMLVVSSGLHLEDNTRVLQLCKKYQNVKAGLGLYPLDGLKMDNEKLERNLKFIEKNRNNLLYIGEVGLDYKDKGFLHPANELPTITNEDKKKQQEIFEQAIALAERLKKPLLIHSRKAEEDCVAMVESSGLRKVIFHCFTGEMKMVRRIADAGWSFSVPASIVRNKHFQQLVGEVNIAQLFTETDAPYLSPYPARRNEPGFVGESVGKIAALKSLDAEETENLLYQNFQKMFLTSKSI